MGETYECDREFERKHRTNVCNSANVKDSLHNSDRLGSGGSGFGRVGVRGVGGVGVRVGGLGRVGNPPTPISQPNSPDLNPPPDHKPPTPTPLTPTPPTPTYHHCVANLPHQHCCKRLSDAYAQILSHIPCVANLLCGESSVANLPCGEFYGNP